MVSTKLREPIARQLQDPGTLYSDQAEQGTKWLIPSMFKDSKETTYDRGDRRRQAHCWHICLTRYSRESPLTLNESRLHKLPDILSSAKGVLWSYGGSIDCTVPESGTIRGSLRNSRSESGGLPYVSLDLGKSEIGLSESGYEAIFRLMTI